MTNKLSGKKLAVLGAGKLGSILLRAYLKQKLFAPKNVTTTVRHEEKAAALAKELGVSSSTDNRKAVRGADIVILGVKPQVVGDVLKEIKAELGEDTLVQSPSPLRFPPPTSNSASARKFPLFAPCPTLAPSSARA